MFTGTSNSVKILFGNKLIAIQKAPDNFGRELLLYVLCGIDNFNLIKQGSSLYFTNSNDCSFSKIRISYKKPVTENNAFTLKYISQESKETVGIYGDGILCCLVEFM